MHRPHPGAPEDSTTPDAPGPGLLERSTVLEHMSGWLADTGGGSGRFVLVEGEAGVGKTSLLQEFAHRHFPRRSHTGLLWAGCDSLAAPRPLAPLADLAPSLGGDIAALLSG